MDQVTNTEVSLSEKIDQTRSFVSCRAFRLQKSSQNSGTRAWAAASLANLRRGVGRPVGEAPETWSLVFEGLPTQLRGIGDSPSVFENAIYASLTLFAVHAQGDREAHVSGRSLGTAVALTERKRDRDFDRDRKPLPSRFKALATAETLSEVLHYSRSLVTLMRANDIGLDYGRLAGDLARFQIPSLRSRVLLQWGRSYYGPLNESHTDEGNH